jgi:syntaxin 18
VESTRTLEGGNVALRKTVSRRGDTQTIIAVILFVATFGLLFLDWMSG